MKEDHELPNIKSNPEATNSNFIWDFSSKKKFIYSYSQTVVVEMKTDKNRPARKSFMTGKGNLNVLVKENNLADLSITDLELSSVYNDDESPSDTMTDIQPAMVVQDMQPDGSFSTENVDILFKILFPLPSSDIKIGESNELAMQLPFNANGSILMSKGGNKLVFEGYETLEGRKCAVLKGTLDISDLEVPEELKGEYISKTTGSATYYFDIRDHCYVGADIQMLMEAKMDSEDKDESDFDMFMDMSSDNKFKIRLRKIEE